MVINCSQVVVGDLNSRLAKNPGPEAIRAYERKIKKLEATC